MKAVKSVLIGFLIFLAFGISHAKKLIIGHFIFDQHGSGHELWVIKKTNEKSTENLKIDSHFGLCGRFFFPGKRKLL